MKRKGQVLINFAFIHFPCILGLCSAHPTTGGGQESQVVIKPLLSGDVANHILHMLIVLTSLGKMY